MSLKQSNKIILAMNMGTKSDAVDNILHEMRQHVSGLQDKLSVAGTAVSKSQTVNEKIAIMKEVCSKQVTFRIPLLKIEH